MCVSKHWPCELWGLYIGETYVERQKWLSSRGVTYGQGSK